MKSKSVLAAEKLLQTLWHGPPPEDQRLLAALDRLLADLHSLPEGSCSDSESVHSREDYKSVRQRVSERFPRYGMYLVADPLSPIGSEPMVADAIDDIADLTTDLREAVWRAQNVSTDDAHWFLKLMLWHITEHARGLAKYLHAKVFS
jgi:hypothetical protein